MSERTLSRRREQRDVRAGVFAAVAVKLLSSRSTVERRNKLLRSLEPTTGFEPVTC